MSLRYTYSRWDGTQRGFEPDADDVLAAITDDLIEHGDVNAALRRLMNDGLRAADGEGIAGLRELLRRLREARRERLERFDLGGVYDEIARELADIVDEERHAIDLAEIEERHAAERHGDGARADEAATTSRGAAPRPRPAAGRPRRQGRRPCSSTGSCRRRPSVASRPCSTVCARAWRRRRSSR